MKPLITDFNASTCRRHEKQSVTNGNRGRWWWEYALIHQGLGAGGAPCCQSKVAPVKISRNDKEMKTLRRAESLGTRHAC